MMQRAGGATRPAPDLRTIRWRRKAQASRRAPVPYCRYVARESAGVTVIGRVGSHRHSAEAGALDRAEMDGAGTDARRRLSAQRW